MGLVSQTTKAGRIFPPQESLSFAFDSFLVFSPVELARAAFGANPNTWARQNLDSSKS
jgi:hypothetical protein